MKHPTLLLLFLFSFFTVHLHAQAISGITDTLDLGGEDIATTMNANQGLDQTISNRNWWLDFLKADSIRIKHNLIFSRTVAISSRNYQRDPGPWVPYQNLNIFYYLKDMEVLQSNLLWQTYRAINAQSTPEPVRQSPLGGRGRPAAQSNDRVMANPNTTTGRVSVPPPWYPIFRQDVLGEFNIRENPRYLRIPPQRARTAPDTRYSTTFRNSQALNRLYHLAFHDSTSDEVYFYGSPAAIIHPDPMIDAAKVITGVYLDISAMAEEAMRLTYNQQHPSARATELNARQLQEVIPMMNNASIPFTYKRILGARRQQLNANLPGLKSSLAVLVEQIDACSAFLSPEEASLFTWLIDQKTQLVAWQTAAIDGLGTILSTSGNTAKYSQLMVVSEYLRVSTVLLSNLTENPKLPYALARVKVPYHDAVMAADRDFRSKLNQ